MGARERLTAPLTRHSSPPPPFSVQRIFEAFLVFWPLATWAVFTWVGEKMPWHTVYFADVDGPAGRLVAGPGHRRDRLADGPQRGIFWLMGMVPLFLIALKALLPASARRPFADVTVSGLSNTIQWLLALVVALVLVYFIYDRVVALGWRQSLRAVRSAWRRFCSC